MKKTLIAVAALAATAAFAQPAVYGRLDIGYATNTTTAAGVDTKDNGFNNDGLVTSYWGIKGSEDLGGGMSANYQLEEAVGLDTGSVGGGFTRISTLGLSGGFGSVMFGRYYTPLFQMAGASDVFGTTGATTVNLANADGVRTSNSLFYASPSMNGLQVKVSFGANDNTASDLSGTGKSSNTGASVGYSNGPLMVGFAIGSNKTETDAGATTADNESNALSATYVMGPAKIFFGMINAKDKLADTKKAETNLGVSYAVGNGLTVMAGVGSNKNSPAVGDDVTGTDTVLGLTKDLSKNTALYVKTGTYNKLNDDKKTTTALGLKTMF